MARKGNRDDDEDMSDDDGDFEDEVEEEEEAEDDSDTSPKKSNKRKKKAAFVDDAASEEEEVRQTISLQLQGISGFMVLEWWYNPAFLLGYSKQCHCYGILLTVASQMSSDGRSHVGVPKPM